MAEDPFQVVIVGGGIAGLEAYLGLHELAGDRVELSLVNPTPEITLKPMIVDEPFSNTPADRFALEPVILERGGRFIQAALQHVDTAGRSLALSDGSTRAFDAAVIATGAKPRVTLASATTLGPVPIQVDRLLRQAAEHPSRRMAFVLPERGSWPLPVYELAFMAQQRARALGLEVTCTVTTPEANPLALFGPEASAKVAELLQVRGIEVRTGAWLLEDTHGTVRLAPGGETFEAGAMLALPALHGPAVSGLPADDDGFLPIDEHARVQGAERVYAAGDGANFPIKHGGLGAQQADAAAEHIASLAGAELEPSPFEPVIRGRLIIGDEWFNVAADLAGDEPDGRADYEPLWWPPQKVAAKYLSALLTESPVHDPGEMPEGVDVLLELPQEWHREPMALDPLSLPDYGEDE